MEDRFADILRDGGTKLVELCTGRTRDGRAFYAFLRMDIESYGRYQDALSLNKPMDLNQFGEILHTGWGTAPDAATSRWMMETCTDNVKILESISKNNSREDVS